jgi:hypothetical protein
MVDQTSFTETDMSPHSKRRTVLFVDIKVTYVHQLAAHILFANVYIGSFTVRSSLRYTLFSMHY